MYKQSGANNRDPSGSSARKARISGGHRLPLTRDQVWKALNDPETLEQCIKGCNRVKIDETGKFHAEFEFRLGPVKKKLVAQLIVKETAPPAQYQLISILRTRRMGGASGRATVQLDQLSRGTQLDYNANIEVDGWFALIGEGAIRAAAGRYMQLFFERFVEYVNQT